MNIKLILFIIIYVCFKQYRLQVLPGRSPYNIKLYMNVEEKKTNQSDNTMCIICQKFYGNQAFKGLCSGCFKKNNRIAQNTKTTKVQVMNSPASTANEITQKMEELTLQNEQTDRKRCFQCRKKVGYLGIECRCKFVFCNSHRLPEDHSCQYDHKNHAQQKLKKEIVKVYNGKITQI